ncbi:hypothetical protein [Streptomyces sp. NPDC056987]|uniref:hypothetical protein n=1 Tax=Streptomyces sp. NPDC056987 TaxID=3345988 RepID=UPI0036253860
MRLPDATGELLGRVPGTAGPELTIPTPFLRAVKDFVPSLTKLAALKSSRADSLEDEAAPVTGTPIAALAGIQYATLPAAADHVA